MSEFWRVFESRQDLLVETLWEHFQISIIALVIATLISVPLGLLLTRSQRVAEPIIGVTAVLQTIPSLAVLAFLIPFVGIGETPAIIALTAYGLLPILRNTYTGIKEVDPALKEAATGMGMNSFRRLSKIELPLAMPVIMAGIRTSMVLIVGTTTIAALIGAGGLGEIILLGLDRGGDPNLILLGAIPAALLAIILDIILRLFERTSAKSGFRSLVSLLVIGVLIAVGPLLFSQERENDLVLGAKLGSEPAILINMYKLLIEEETDLQVGLEPNFGKTDFVFSALQQGSIDIYPEFTGTALVALLEQQANSNEPQEVYQQAAEGMSETYDMAFLQPMQFNNTYAVATTQELAERYNLETIGDLQPVQDQLTAGFTLEFKDRQDGYQGMKELYNLNLGEVKTMDPGVRQTAITTGEVDIIDAYATAGYMVDLNLKVLEDPKNLFPPYQGAPLMRQETLDRYPEIEDVLNQLGGKITGDQMREMNYQVDFEDRSPREVAKEYLVSEGLIEE
ncbi:ABC transporter permease/substrate-binding protein [Halobacillus locisalis]|uniref:ABC transporter permease/substrate-binding protein n=1 Tax=Halobacillus locisalis TaxID=220753 RepID=A0A838CQ47_9BACI|nr:ABC transporter permease/substrate-binding protein [Halobacillus locisalis]MBA2173993.1 ABC transporter permease/substrate-binding protein [Halobacillus locisalis]